MPTSAVTPASITTETVIRVGHAMASAYVVCVQGNHVYVGAGANLVILDVSDPTRPRSVGRVALPYTVLAVDVAGEYAYVAAGPKGLHVVDVSDPARPTPVGAYDALPCAHAVAVCDSHVYIAAGPGGLHVVDVSNPATSALVSVLPIPGAWTHDVTVAGHYAYVAGYDFFADRGRCQVVDVTDPAAPVVVGTHDLPGWAWDAAVAGDQAYVADGRRGGLRMIDVSNSAAPMELSFYHPRKHRVYDVAVMDTTAYMAAGPEGLWVLDVSNPAAPVTIAHYDTSGDAMGVAATDALVYVAGGAVGLDILRVASSPIKPAPTAAPAPTPQPTAPPPIAAISPDEFEARIREDGASALRSIGRELGIGEGYWGGQAARELGIPEEPWQPQVERYDVELDRQPGLEVMLKISKEDRFRRYLVFTREASHWKFLGHVDTYSKYAPLPQHRIVTIDEQGIWLVVQDHVGSGMGFQIYVEKWFEIGGAKPRLVLEYPVQGLSAPGGALSSPDMEWQGEIVSYQKTGGYTVDIQFTEWFAEGGERITDGGLFSCVRRARYVWDPIARRFVFDPAQSELSRGEIEGGGGGGFIRQYYEELARLAADPDEWPWLKRLLSDQGYRKVEDVPERRALATIMDSLPADAGLYDRPGKALDVAVAGRYAYVAADKKGLRVVDVSNPAAPMEVGAYNTPGRAQGVAVVSAPTKGEQRIHAYVADGELWWRLSKGNVEHEIGLWVVDVSDPAAPIPTGFCDTPGAAVSVAVAEPYAYVASVDPNNTGDPGLRIVDISNPTAPVEVGVYRSPGSIRDVALAPAGDPSTGSGQAYAYVAAGEGGLCIVDVSEPATPTEIGVYRPQHGYRYVDAVAVAGHYAYVTNRFGGGLRVIDVLDPAAPIEVSFCDTKDASGLAVAGSYAYVAIDGYYDDVGGGIWIIDISDPTAPVKVGAYVIPGGLVQNVAVAPAASGRIYAYVAAGYQGLRVIDVTDPTAPVEVGFCGQRTQ